MQGKYGLEKKFKKFKNYVDFYLIGMYNKYCSQEWRNWQTRTVQVRVVAIP